MTPALPQALLAKLRSNRLRLLTVAGFVGGVIGGIVSAPLYGTNVRGIDSAAGQAAVVLMIDTSSSMSDGQPSRIELAKQGVLDVIDVAVDDLDLGLLAFSDRAAGRWIFDLQPATPTNVPSMIRAVSTLRPSGGTFVLDAYQRAVQALESTSADVKHIIVLSDGRFGDQQASLDAVVSNAVDPWYALARGALRSGITTSTLGVGRGFDRSSLTSLASGGDGRFYDVSNPGALPDLFVTETMAATRTVLGGSGAMSIGLATFIVIATTGLVGLFVTASLVLASEWHLHRPLPNLGSLRSRLIAGATGGALGGFGAQLMYATFDPPAAINELIVRPIAWGCIGIVLAVTLMRSTPGLSARNAVLGGFGGGFAGSFVLLIASAILPDAIGRIGGLGALGAGIGATILLVDVYFREASVDVVWAPNEVSTVSLGEHATTIGGTSTDDIYVPGLPKNACALQLRAGRVVYIDGTTEQETPLRDGSQIMVGTTSLVVRTSRG